MGASGWCAGSVAYERDGELVGEHHLHGESAVHGRESLVGGGRINRCRAYGLVNRLVCGAGDHPSSGAWVRVVGVRVVWHMSGMASWSVSIIYRASQRCMDGSRWLVSGRINCCRAYELDDGHLR